MMRPKGTAAPAKRQVERMEHLPQDTTLEYSGRWTGKNLRYQKQYSWRCLHCGSTYTWKSKAQECADNHELDDWAKAKGYEGIEDYLAEQKRLNT